MNLCKVLKDYNAGIMVVNNRTNDSLMITFQASGHVRILQYDYRDVGALSNEEFTNKLHSDFVNFLLDYELA